MGDRDYCLAFEPMFVAPFVLVVIVGILTEGPILVLIALAAAALLGGLYFLTWRWWRTRRGKEARFRK